MSQVVSLVSINNVSYIWPIFFFLIRGHLVGRGDLKLSEYYSNVGYLEEY